MKTSLVRSFQAAVALALLSPLSSFASPVLGAPIIVSGSGDVIATFQGQGASYDNELYLDLWSSSTRIFHNHLNSVGDTVNLGSFAIGTELIFRLYVVNTGNTFFSGAASRNADGIFHAMVDDTWAPGQTLVGFEDLLGGGDRDYDDTLFSFTNVKGRSVPDAASTAGLLLIGMSALFFSRRRVTV